MYKSSILSSINKPPIFLPTHIQDLLITELVTKVKPDFIKSVKVHPQLSCTGHPVMLLQWMLGHSGPNTVDVVKFEAGYSSKSANRAAKSPPLKNKNPNSKKVQSSDKKTQRKRVPNKHDWIHEAKRFTQKDMTLELGRTRALEKESTQQP